MLHLNKICMCACVCVCVVKENIQACNISLFHSLKVFSNLVLFPFIESIQNAHIGELLL